MNIHRKILQVSVVNPHNIRPCTQRFLYFRRIVSLYQRREPQGKRNLPVFPQLALIQNGTDQQNRRCPQQLCLPDHIGIDREILSENRDRHRPGDFLQIPVTAQEPFRFGQTGDGRSTGLFIFPCNLQIWKLLRNQSFGRRRLLHLADKGHPLRGQRLIKRKTGLRIQAFRLPPKLRRRDFLLRLFCSVSGIFGQFIQNRHLAAPPSLFCSTSLTVPLAD